MKLFKDMRRAAVVQWAPLSQRKSFSCRSTPHDYTGWKFSRLKWYNQLRERGDDRKLSHFNSDIVLTILMYSSCRFISSTREIYVLVLKLQINPCQVYLRTSMWSLTYKSAHSCQVSIYLESICAKDFTSSLWDLGRQKHLEKSSVMTTAALVDVLQH